MMDPSHHFDTIDKTTFDDILTQYPNVVPDKLKDLDSKRYDMVVATGESSEKCLTKDQVVTLVEWKLSHGTFRPKLKQLVESNSDETIKEVTTSGLSELSLAKTESVKTAMTRLTALKGIGPATASLLMSVADPAKVPFFSDEFFRWSFFEDAKSKGWDRPIKYTPKEYLELFGKVQQLVTRIGVSAVDAEKVAYVLGKQGTGKVKNGEPKSTSNSNKRKADNTTAETAKPAAPAKKSKTEESRPIVDSKPAAKAKKVKTSSEPAKEAKPPTRSSARVKARG